MDAAVMADHFDSINKLPEGVAGVPNWRCVPGYQVQNFRRKITSVTRPKKFLVLIFKWAWVTPWIGFFHLGSLLFHFAILSAMSRSQAGSFLTSDRVNKVKGLLVQTRDALKYQFCSFFQHCSKSLWPPNLPPFFGIMFKKLQDCYFGASPTQSCTDGVHLSICWWDTVKINTENQL